MNALHVLFRVGEAEYAVPASEVVHMETYTGATPVPGTPGFVAGLVQIRQRVVPVVDLRARFALPPLEPSLASRVIVIQTGPRTVGLLVDTAREVTQLDPEKTQPPPEVVAQKAAGFVRGVAQVKDRLVLLIDLEKVLGEEALDGQQPVA